MGKTIRILALAALSFLAVLAALSASCALDWDPPDSGWPEDDADGQTDGVSEVADDDGNAADDAESAACDPGDCSFACVGAAYASGDCVREICVCIEGADADADADGEAGSDESSDGDGDAEADAAADAATDEDIGPEDAGGGCAGGWMDTSTGLCWQDPPDAAARTWGEAYGYCSSLSLGGFGPGSWHLPTIDEIRSLIRGCPGTVTGGACGIGPGCYVCETGGGCWSAACDGCTAWAGPGTSGCYWDPSLAGGCYHYWSSTDCGGPMGAYSAWAVNFGLGSLIPTDKTFSYPLVRCVRIGS